MRDIGETTIQRALPDPTTRVRVSAKDELEVWVTGEGTPVVVVHGAMTRDLLKPLADELARRGGYQVIHYGRRGYGGGGLPAEAADIPGQATDIVAILDALGVDRAHVVGHSFGAYVALELATRAPDRLLSTALLEPPFSHQVRSEAALQGVREVVEVAMPLIVEKHMSGDRDGAVVMLGESTSGVAGVMELIEAVLPTGARELAAVDLNTFLQVDLPAMASWIPEPAKVKEISTPIAWIGGADSPPLMTESRALLQGWLPTTVVAEVEGAGHYFPVLRPAETADRLDELLRRWEPAP